MHLIYFRLSNLFEHDTWSKHECRYCTWEYSTLESKKLLLKQKALNREEYHMRLILCLHRLASLYDRIYIELVAGEAPKSNYRSFRMAF